MLRKDTKSYEKLMEKANQKLEREGVKQNKQDKIFNAGFLIDLDRGLFVHYEKRIVLSIHAVALYDESWLENQLENKSGGTKWQFGFVGGDPLPAIRKDIICRYEPQRIMNGVSNLFGG